jgi:serine protease
MRQTASLMSVAIVLGFSTLAIGQPVPPEGPAIERASQFRLGPLVHHELERAPKPRDFVQPRLDGIYAEMLRAGDTGRGAILKGPLHPYAPYRTPATPPDSSRFNTRQIVVKFTEGASIRLRKGSLVVDPSAGTPDANRRLERSGLTLGQIASDLRSFNSLVTSARGLVGRGSPGVAEADLARLLQRAEARTGAELPDPNLWYFVYLKDLSAEQAQTVLREFQAVRIVETAYFQPIPFDATDQPPITTIDVTAAEGYFSSAPTGIDVNYARRFSGGRGNAVRVADIESGWNTSHEDLPSMAFNIGVNWGGDHGTAVLGELVAEENGFGATGIAPNAVAGWSSTTNFTAFGNQSSVYFYSVANALLMLGKVLRTGDVAVIEQQFLLDGIICQPGDDPCSDGTNCGDQFGMVAVEEYPFEHATISVATGAGIVVVEAAGNGRTKVTPASSQDSGAIVVGASDNASPTNPFGPACFTNFGPRVDVHGWGAAIGTLGYGADPALRANGNDANQWYTAGFGGTSGATPIVAGAVVIVQATRDVAGLARLSSVQMRSLLVQTGTPQAMGLTKQIGPLPNLRAALASYLPDHAQFVNWNPPSGTLALNDLFDVAVTFKNDGGQSWQGAHIMAISPGNGGPVWVATTSPVGTVGGPVLHGDEATNTLHVHAPGTSGTYDFQVLLRGPNGTYLAASPLKQLTVAAPGMPHPDAVLTLTSAPGSMHNGESGVVQVNAQNTGATTWVSGDQFMKLNRGYNISLPQPTVELPNSVAPGQSISLNFNISCNGQGQGLFQAQMDSASGLFGNQIGKTVVCQP